MCSRYYSWHERMQNLDTLFAALRAAGEHTHLRLLAVCVRSELSVSELTQTTPIPVFHVHCADNVD